MVGWWDTYLINSVFFEGLLLKVATPTYNVFVFLEKSLELTKSSFLDGKLPGIVELLLQEAGLGKSEDDTNSPKILTLSNMTRGEIYDNSKEGTQGFICFMATLATKLSVKRSKSLVRGWLTLE